jgi:peptide deformylase
MSLLPITIYGDKILRKKTAAVTRVDNETIELIRDMFATMRNANGIGLAANQVGADQQIFVVDISKVEGFEDSKPLIIINPRIIEKSEKTNKMEEGCLSIPDVRVDIERPEEVTIAYQDIDLNEHTVKADDILARVIQHEYDHLQGVLFIDYLTEDQKKEFKKELENIKNRKMDVDYPVTESAG